jgi:hypothetical protein
MRLYAFAAMAGAALSLSTALADTISLQASRDNTLFESMTGATSNGAGPNFFVGRNSQGSIRRALLRFDLASIPAGSTITSVSLTLVASQTQGPATDIALHRTLADWGEAGSQSSGGGGAPSQPGDATWIHTFFNTSLWTNAGGDFTAAASATESVFEPGIYTWDSTSDLIADAQSWLDNPSSNYGWTLTGLETTSGTAKRFESREGPENARPVFTVEYVVPAPSAAGVAALAGLVTLRRRRTPVCR